MHSEMRKKRNKVIFFILFLGLLSAGCGKKEEITLEPVSVDTQEEPQGNTNRTKDSAESEAGNHTQEEENPAESASDERPDKATDITSVWVYVCGAVNTPGVYELESGSRIYQAIAMAGGLTPEAAQAYVNQAEPVTDGGKIYVPKAEEVSQAEMLQGNEAAEASAGGSSETDITHQSGGKVNINTADLAGLQTLPGIGEVRAAAIIAYREGNGLFTETEQIMRVEGIKEGTFLKIQDLICIQ